MAAAPAEIFFLSYPKTGRTWLRMMIGKYICDRHAFPLELIPATYAITARAGLPRAEFNHGTAAFRLHRHYTEINTGKSDFRNTKVMLLGRNIHDTLVSAHLHVSHRMGIYTGSLRDFIRDEALGAAKFLAYYRQWHENQGIPREFRFLRYEDMHADPAGALLSSLEYIGVTDIDQDLLAAAVRFGSFDNLKRLEAANPRFVGPKPQATQHPESAKIRRGKIGGYVDYMSAEDIAYVDELNRSMGCEFTRPKADG